MNPSPVLQFRVPLPFDAAERAVREALQTQGFGILTEVDVTAVLRAKLGIEIAPQKLLGACNPTLAHRSLETEPAVGAFLPCGLSLRAGSTDGETIVALQDPALIANTFANPGLAEPANEARTRLAAALASVGTEI